MLEKALAPLIEGFAADGYVATVTDKGGNRAVLEITAGPEACADCLVPSSVLAPIISQVLREAGLSYETEIIYPVERH